MKLVGLTGGIGSGKSTVTALLRERGAVVIDADEVVRSLQVPGSPVLAAIAAAFGDQVIGDDGSLDRAALAQVVFADPDARTQLNRIVHPAVRVEMDRRVAALATTDAVVVLDIPLLTEHPRDGLQGIIVVDVPEDVQVERLVRYRGFSEVDARARIAAQASRQQRLNTATWVIDNSGDLGALDAQVAGVWEAFDALPAVKDPAQQ